MAETTFDTPFGAVDLRRGNTSLRSPLRAWSAADRLVLGELAGTGLVTTDGSEANAAPALRVGTDAPSILLVNDAWGALSVPLAAWQPMVWSDSAVARDAIDANLVANGQPPLGDRAVPGDRGPTQPVDVVVVRVPKSYALLRHQARVLAPHVAVGTRVLAYGMSRQLNASVTDALVPLGAAVPRRAVGKARLIDVTPQPEAVVESPAADLTTEAFRTDRGIVVHEAPGVFSAGHLDVGTALLLDHAVALDPASLGAGAAPRCLDLACGNGVIAATLARAWSTSHWSMTDASDLAACAARATWVANGLAADRARVTVCDAAGSIDDASIDIVVTNPPFHHEHAVDAELTERVVADGARVLADDGAALVVAQRHVDAHHTLRRHFDSVEALSRHRTHVVLVARGPRRRGGAT